MTRTVPLVKRVLWSWKSRKGTNRYEKGDGLPGRVRADVPNLKINK